MTRNSWALLCQTWQDLRKRSTYMYRTYKLFETNQYFLNITHNNRRMIWAWICVNYNTLLYGKVHIRLATKDQYTGEMAGRGQSDNQVFHTSEFDTMMFNCMLVYVLNVEWNFYFYTACDLLLIRVKLSHSLLLHPLGK